MAAEVDLSAVMEHLAIAFGGIYEKLTERDREVAKLHTDIAIIKNDLRVLSNRIEATHRSLSKRVGEDDPRAVAAELVVVLERVERALAAEDDR